MPGYDSVRPDEVKSLVRPRDLGSTSPLRVGSGTAMFTYDMLALYLTMNLQVVRLVNDPCLPEVCFVSLSPLRDDAVLLMR